MPAQLPNAVPAERKAEPAAEHGIRLSRALGKGRPGPSSQVLASVCMIAELLQTRVCAMTFAAVARRIYGTPLARMPPDDEGKPDGDHQFGCGGWAAAGGLGRGG